EFNEARLRPSAEQPARKGKLLLVVDLDALFLAHRLDVDVHRRDDLCLRIGFAIDDDPMLELLGAIDLQLAVASQAVVPAAVPDGHEVSVFLKGVGELSASQLLDVQVALRIGIGGQLDLSLRGSGAKQRHCTNRYHQFHFFPSLSKRGRASKVSEPLDGAEA